MNPQPQFKTLSDEDKGKIVLAYMQEQVDHDMMSIKSTSLSDSALNGYSIKFNSSLNDFEFEFDFDEHYSPIQATINLNGTFLKSIDPSKKQLINFLKGNNWWRHQIQVKHYQHHQRLFFLNTTNDLEYGTMNMLDFKDKPLFVLNPYDEKNRIHLTQKNTDRYQKLLNEAFEEIEIFLSTELNLLHKNLRRKYNDLFKDEKLQNFIDMYEITI